MNRRTTAAVSLLQASQDSPVLSRLLDLADESSARLVAIAPLLPKPLLGGIRPGPVDGGTWCLLLDSNAIAAKLRQLLPTLLAHLKNKGFVVETIRLKVQPSDRPR